MQQETYLQSLAKQMASVDLKIAAAQQRLDNGTMTEKVSAAGELSLLKTKHQELAERAGQAAKHHADDWSQLHSEFQRDCDALADAIDRWITKHATSK